MGAPVHGAVLPLARARTLAYAFRYFWLGELDAAVCIALPQVEQIFWSIRAKVPSLAQRRKRMCRVVHRPYCRRTPERARPRTGERARLRMR